MQCELDPFRLRGCGREHAPRAGITGDLYLEALRRGLPLNHHRLHPRQALQLERQSNRTRARLGSPKYVSTLFREYAYRISPTQLGSSLLK